MGDSMRDALEEAFESDEEENPVAEVSAAAEPTEPEEQTPTPQELMTDEPPETEGAAPEAESIETEEADKTADPATNIKAPPSWSPKAKEQWSEVPVGLQSEIIERERSYSIGIQRNAETAKLGAGIRQALQPYAQIMAAEGADEVSAVSNLAQHAAIMRVGTPSEKVNRVAQIIQTYGIDVGMLDDVLSGEGVDPQTSQLNQIIDQRMAPVNQLMTEINRTRQNTANNASTQMNSEIESFRQDTNNEFFEDVRMQMADIIEVQGRSNNVMSIQDAYNTAISMRPDIQEILNSRSKRENIASAAKGIGRKKAASSSVTGSPASASSLSTTSLRGTLEDAWNNAGQEA